MPPGWGIPTSAGGARSRRTGRTALRESPELEQRLFPQLGFRLHVLEPGQPSGLYHAESEQEDFLVLAGECLLVVEEEERHLRAWDFVHCPPGTRHVFVGTDRQCVILMTGARTDKGTILAHSPRPPLDTASRRGRDALAARGVRASFTLAAGASDCSRLAMEGGSVSRARLSAEPRRLEVGHVEEALEFYGRIFDFELRGRAGRMAFVDMGDQFVAFAQARTQPPDAHRHFGLVVDDKEVARRALQEAGVEALAPAGTSTFAIPGGDAQGCRLPRDSVYEGRERPSWHGPGRAEEEREGARGASLQGSYGQIERRLT